MASTGCTEWCYWSSKGSTKLNVWESKDLVTWSDLRQFDVALSDGAEVAELGMAWAPEATWVEDYYPDGSGAFVLLLVIERVLERRAHRIELLRASSGARRPTSRRRPTTYGGVFIDAGGNTIDTSIIQDEGKTYRITKDNSQGKGIYMESTPAAEWWKPTATWTQLQTRIGAVWASNNAGGVEGPAVFKRHDEDKWYLYVDVIPSTGLPADADDRPRRRVDAARQRQLLHGAEHEARRHRRSSPRPATTRFARRMPRPPSRRTSATSRSRPTPPRRRCARRFPASAEVALAYGRGTASQPVDWDLSAVDTGEAGTYEVTGTVRTIGANLNQWVGAGGSTAWNAPGKELYSSTAVK